MINLGQNLFDCGDKVMSHQVQDNIAKTTADMDYNMSHNLTYTSQGTPPSPIFDESYIPETIYTEPNCGALPSCQQQSHRYWQTPQAFPQPPQVHHIKGEPVEHNVDSRHYQELGPQVPPLGPRIHHQSLLAAHSEMERFKLERKRERNRIAASKCRMRKLERIAQLDGQVAQLRQENSHLSKVADSLRNEVKKLQEQMRQHIESGCDLELPPCIDNTHYSELNPDSTCLT